jgi:predicted unusual protein kinase regulating ubiquinone biosynthesis (AarF/ABC1/UbiB family)
MTTTIERAWIYARIGWQARAVRRAPSEGARAAARRALAAALGDARGLATKFGQLGAALSGASELEPLLSGVEPFSWSEIRPRVEASLGARVEDLFEELDPRGIGASLGQVHRGLLRSGEAVAVKVRYPEIERALEAELRIAGWLPSAGPVRRWGFDLGAYHRLLRRELGREIDYLGEAERQERFRQAVAGDGIVVPRIRPELCRRDVLVQSWEEGETLASAATWSLAERLRLGQAALRLLVRSLFVLGELHSDPHPGNYRFRGGARPELVLYDFGSTLPLDAARRRALLGLLIALREGERALVVPLLAELGFASRKLLALGGETIEACRILFAPWLARGPFDLREWRLGENVDAALGDLRWAFRAAAPADALLFVRAIAGIVRILAELDVRLPWWPILEEAVGRDGIAEARSYRPEPVAGATPQAGIARWLRVEVEEEERDLFTVALAASEALEIASLTPREIDRALRASGVRLTEIERRVRREGLAPGVLFDVVAGKRRYRARLE